MQNIIVWGTGSVSKQFVKYLKNGNILAFIESEPSSPLFMSKPVLRITEIDFEWDILIVASSFAKDIKEKCDELAIPRHKIIFLRSFYDLDEKSFNRLYNLDVLRDIAPDIPKDIFQGEDKIITSRMKKDRIEAVALNEKFHNYTYDYTRFRTFDLVADELKMVAGNIAELGVFRGDFACYMNEKFPNRKLYLFDTFEGFDEKEAKREIEEKNCQEDFVDTFKNTSIGIVMDKMKYPHNCIVRKGLFPKTVLEIEEVFAFVSLDVDFEESIYEGLLYFYPRLSDGGYIFIHDYNTSFLHGVRKAIKRFEENFGRIKKVPIADNGGTIIITK